MFKISDHGQIFLDYLIGYHVDNLYMGLPMAFSRNRAINELAKINRYIAIDGSDERHLSKFKLCSYYQGIVFWILDSFQPSSFVDTNAARTLNLLCDLAMKSNAKLKISYIDAKAGKQVR